MIAPATNKKKQFELCPKGKQVIVLADVVDLGMVTTEFQGKEKTQHKVRLVWLTAAKDSKGKPFRLFQRVTLSSHPKSQLYGIVSDITGEEPRGEIETEDLIGAVAEAFVVHEPVNGTTYANIKSLMPSDADLKVPGWFVRDQDKEQAPPDNDNPFGEDR